MVQHTVSEIYHLCNTVNEYAHLPANPSDLVPLVFLLAPETQLLG